MVALVDEITSPGWMLPLTGEVILMGHSFGGMTSLHAATLRKQVVAAIVMDPWFMTYKDDIFKLNKPCQILMTEHFAAEMAAKYPPTWCSEKECLNKFIRMNPHTDLKVLKDNMHFNQTDHVVISPDW